MEDKEKIQDKPLWVYSGNKTPDVAALVMILLGSYLCAAFSSSAPGILIRPICSLLTSWFGKGALFLSVLMVLGGIAVLIMRRLPRIRVPRKVVRLKMLLSVLLFVLICGILAGAVPEGQGGSTGAFLLHLFSQNIGKGLGLFILRLLFLADVYFLLEMKRLAEPFRMLIQVAADQIFPHPERPFTDGSEFDWEKEFRIQNLRSAVSSLSRYKEEDTDPVDDLRESDETYEDSGGLLDVPFKLHPVASEAEIDDLTQTEEYFSGPEPRTPDSGAFVMSGMTGEFERNKREIRGSEQLLERREQLKKISEMNYKTENRTTDKPLPERSTQLPPLNLLDTELGFYGQNMDHHEFMEALETAMGEFGAPVHVVGCEIGPSVIQYQLVPGNISREDRKGKVTSRNVRVSQVAQLDRDLAVCLGVSSLSIQAPVPGESYIGIDIPNPNAMMVRLRPLIESAEFRRHPAALNIALGRNITGKPVIVNLGSMPHLLVAGTTNSGKSICLRAMAVCLAMNNTPEQVRMVMIDPKRVELYRFNGLPHLLGKVETEYERSIAVLEWAVQEMQNRYKLFQTTASHKIQDYNRYAEKHGLKPLPYIVIFVDEMAEIMKGADKQGEICIDTLARLARAAGMHLVLATQRPDTTILTGKIKTNIPARIALTVASAIDSRVIMEKAGAEKLLSHGDMYFIDPTLSVPVRVQGAMMTDREIDRVVNLWKKLWKPDAGESASPWEEMIEANSGSSGGEGNPRDEQKLREAVRLVCRTGKASAAYLSGKLKISFPTASRLLSRMEDMGVVGPMQTGGKAREVIWDEDEGEDYYASGASSGDFGYEENDGSADE